MDHALDTTEIPASAPARGGNLRIARAHARGYSQMLAFFLFVSLTGNVWGVYALRALAAEHKEDMKQNFTVWRVGADGTTNAHLAGEFRTGADEAQMNAVAWRIVSLIESAGSADVKENYRRARLDMAPTLASDFDDNIAVNAPEIEELGVYNVFDQPELRQAVTEDFPVVERLSKLTRYDRIVIGTRTTYSIETREALLKPKRVAYYVRLSPLPAPEVAHPEGLLVDTLIPMKLKGVNDEQPE